MTPPGAGRLQVSTHGDVPFPVVGTSEDGGDSGERVGTDMSDLLVTSTIVSK